MVVAAGWSMDSRRRSFRNRERKRVLRRNDLNLNEQGRERQESRGSRISSCAASHGVECGKQPVASYHAVPGNGLARHDRCEPAVQKDVPVAHAGEIVEPMGRHQNRDACITARTHRLVSQRDASGSSPSQGSSSTNRHIPLIENIVFSPTS